MTVFGSLFGGAGRPRPLRVNNGDAFSACCERFGVTPRECEIIRLLIEGKDNKGITEELFISDHTVKNHIHNIYRKLGIKNRVQLVQCFRGALEEPGRPAPEAAPGPGDARAGFRRMAVTAALFLVVVAAVLALWKPRGKNRAVPRPDPVLAVLDFENFASDPDLEKWMTGLPLLLATDLHQSKHIRTLSDDTVFGALKKLGLAERRRYSRDELRRLAKYLKADYLLTGTLMKAGGKIIATAVLQDARTGAPLRTDKIECQDEQDLMNKADGLARLVKSGLNLTAAQADSDVDIDAEVLTTSSALAYKYYAEGRRYHRTGDYEQALLMQRKAVELDPEFAMAYRAMAVAARNLGYYEQESALMKKAFDFAEGLPENCRERQLIRGDYYSLSEATYAQSAEAFKRVLEDHPDDPVVSNNLGMLFFDMEDFEAALKYAGVPIRQGTDYPFPYYTSAVSLNALGRPGEAVRLLESYHGSFPANRLIFEVLVDSLITANDFAGAEAAIDRARGVFPDPSWSLWKGTVLFHTRGSGAAREEFRRLFLLDMGTFGIRARARLGEIALAEGRFREAEDQFRAGAELAESMRELEWAADLRRFLGQTLMETEGPGAALAEARKAAANALASNSRPRLRAALHFQGQASFRMKDFATVESLAAQFESMDVAEAGKRPGRDRDFFLGMLELERGRPLEAVKLIEKALALVPSGYAGGGRKPLMAFSLGAAREKAGDPAGASLAYESIAGAPGDRLPCGDLFARAVLGLARVEEGLGRRARALEHYRRFLELWKDADPGRPEVEEAGARQKILSGLPGQGR